MCKTIKIKNETFKMLFLPYILNLHLKVLKEILFIYLYYYLFVNNKIKLKISLNTYAILYGNMDAHFCLGVE